MTLGSTSGPLLLVVICGLDCLCNTKQPRHCAESIAKGITQLLQIFPFRWIAVYDVGDTLGCYMSQGATIMTLRWDCVVMAQLNHIDCSVIKMNVIS